MKRRLSLSFLSLVGMVTMTIVPITVVSVLWIVADLGAYRKQAAELRSEYLEEQRSALKREVDEAVRYVEYSKSLTEKRLMESIRERTDEAHAIAMGMYDSRRLTRPRQEIHALILAALEPIRFNEGRGYYFVFNLQGVELLSADQPELEGQSLLEARDTEGRYVIKDMIDLAKSEGEGYYRYTWTKPTGAGGGFPKISFIKLFEPYGWFIGTGEYLDDVERDIQEEVLERLSQVTPGRDGRIFVGRWDGSMLVDSVESQGPGGPGGGTVIQELIAAARSGGGYVESVAPKPDDGRLAPRLSYAAPIADWGWYVGSGRFVDDIDAVVRDGATELGRRVRTRVIGVTVFLAAILALILIPGRRVLGDTKRSFDDFTAFFRQAAVGAARIDPARFRYREMYDLAESADAMAERRQAAESALRESEERYRTLVASSFEGILVSRNGKVIDVTPQLVAMTGREPEEVIGRDAVDFVHPSDRKALGEAVRRRDGKPHRYRLLHRDGSVVEIEARSRYFQHQGGEVRVTAIRDITEQRRAEEAMARLQGELVQAQKMEAVGRLAGGVAHDFNNILTAIMGYSELIRAEAGTDGPIAEGIEEVRRAAERAASLTQQLLAFSRKQVLQPRVLDLNALIVDMSRMLVRLVGEDILLVSTLDASRAHVCADPTQIEQVILNLAVNARDAMPKGGELTVGTRNVSLDGSNLEGHPGLGPGEYVVLSVSDTGVGMDDSVKSHLFEPFFTTKETGRGTGLGLPTVYGIVRQSGGHIAVDSEPGRGTVVRVHLPLASESLRAGPEVASGRAVTGGEETVLLVEDEESLLVLAATILGRYGYKVVKMRGPREALERLRAPDCPDFDLLITDVIMPLMSGRELADAARGLRPNMKVLFVSGYTNDAILHHGVLDPGVEFLQKPFAPSVFAQKVREVLDR